MQSAKDSVKKFMSSSGHHETTVHEKVAPAVTQEQVSRTQHENVMPVVDKEIHQDHHHTTVQPVNHSETLSEQHHHQAMPVEHRSFEHDDKQDVDRRLADERAQFMDKTHHVEGERTTSQAAAMAGEHKHHHVHETIQPVVHKQTIEPHVVHTTVPVHEVHHNSTQHHAASSLPAVSMDDFKKGGGSLMGREERTDHFNDEPRLIGEKSNTSNRSGAVQPTSELDRNSGHFQGERDDAGQRGTSQLAPSSTNGSTGNYSSTDTSTATKPSFMDKLNPKKDADGDGKSGFMK